MDRTELTPDQVTAAIVQLLEDCGAKRWTIQEKGVMMAAIKLQLMPSETPLEE